MVEQHSSKKGEEPQTGLPLGKPLLSGVWLSDVTYRIQRSRIAKTKVIYADRLKPYLGPALKSWNLEREGTVMPDESLVVTAGKLALLVTLSKL